MTPTSKESLVLHTTDLASKALAESDKAARDAVTAILAGEGRFALEILEVAAAERIRARNFTALVKQIAAHPYEDVSEHASNVATNAEHAWDGQARETLCQEIDRQTFLNEPYCANGDALDGLGREPAVVDHVNDAFRSRLGWLHGVGASEVHTVIVK